MARARLIKWVSSSLSNDVKFTFCKKPTEVQLNIRLSQVVRLLHWECCSRWPWFCLLGQTEGVYSLLLQKEGDLLNETWHAVHSPTEEHIKKVLIIAIDKNEPFWNCSLDKISLASYLPLWYYSEHFEIPIPPAVSQSARTWARKQCGRTIPNQ